ncbi:hypothetical protein ZWY2020_022264 [Hordeum vulgare]|nr:hypothetical protein ZWY2020_022264 [Hordeum vulgare]
MASTAALQAATVCTLLLFAGQLLPTATPAPEAPFRCAPGDAKCLACVDKCMEPCRRDPTQCRVTLRCEPQCAAHSSSPPPPPPPPEVPFRCAPGDAKCLACVNKCIEPCRRDPTQCRVTLLCEPQCAAHSSSPPPPSRESGTCARTNAKCLACVKKCGDRCRRDPTQCRMTMYCEPGCAIQTSSHRPPKDICGPAKGKCVSCVNKCRETCQGDPISCGGLLDCEKGCAHQKQ